MAASDQIQAKHTTCESDFTTGYAVLQPGSRLHCTSKVSSGSPPEVAVWALMSALADSGRATGSAWVRVVPGPDVSRCSKQRTYSMVLGASTILGSRIAKVDP